MVVCKKNGDKGKGDTERRGCEGRVEETKICYIENTEKSTGELQSLMTEHMESQTSHRNKGKTKAVPEVEKYTKLSRKITKSSDGKGKFSQRST